MARLTTKQRLFVEAYCGPALGNATEAARLAGYKGNDVTLSSVGSENLRKPQIAEAIEQAKPEIEAVATRHERQAFLTSVMRGERQKGLWPDISERMHAANLLNKMDGSYIQRVEVSTGAGDLSAEERRRRLAELRALEDAYGAG